MAKLALVVDDDKDSREFVVRLLKQMDFIVLERSNAKNALKVMEEVVFHLVVTDYKMPEMNGLELTRWIRTQENPRIREIPVIMRTGVEFNDEEKEVVRKAGVNLLVSKLANLEELKLAVSEFVK